MRELGPYPVRLNKRVWKIPLCEVMTDDNGNNIIKQTAIHLHSFDMKNPMGLNGKLYMADTQVIDKPTFKVTITFPLSSPIIANISFENSDCTLKNVLRMLKNLYTFIYNEEEDTSTAREYIIMLHCDNCFEKGMEEFVTINKVKNSNEMCPICHCDYESGDTTSVLHCSHFFHKNCLEKWSENGDTCPMCRKKIINCFLCQGKRLIESVYNGVVIPKGLRGIIANRNPTDGVFGIHSFDFEDLVITGLTYNKDENRLHIDVRPIFGLE